MRQQEVKPCNQDKKQNEVKGVKQHSLYRPQAANRSALCTDKEWQTCINFCFG